MIAESEYLQQRTLLAERSPSVIFREVDKFTTQTLPYKDRFAKFSLPGAGL
jgi:hypothetical protein